MVESGYWGDSTELPSRHDLIRDKGVTLRFPEKIGEHDRDMLPRIRKIRAR